MSTFKTNRGLRFIFNISTLILILFFYSSIFSQSSNLEYGIGFEFTLQKQNVFNNINSSFAPQPPPTYLNDQTIQKLEIGIGANLNHLIIELVLAKISSRNRIARNGGGFGLRLKYKI